MNIVHRVRILLWRFFRWLRRPRAENKIFEHIARLSSSSGFAHTIAYLCFRDNALTYTGELKPDDIKGLYGHERLIRTEISTLIGLLVKQSLDLSLPCQWRQRSHIKKADKLLKELHRSLEAPMMATFLEEIQKGGTSSPLSSGTALREAIFYGGESAYSFQYRDLFPTKYGNDDTWLQTNKGFSVTDAASIAKAIGEIQNAKIETKVHSLRSTDPRRWTFLDAFYVTVDEVVSAIGTKRKTVESFFSAFETPTTPCNQGFESLQAFNVTNAFPLIPVGGGRYLLYQQYSLVEALYESPFYWMLEDPTYRDTASTNRGEFTESYTAERLEVVFGSNRVFKNVTIQNIKGKDAGEIDVLVVFADRAILVQAKSKRLTIEARKGNDNQLRSDFKKSIQDSYDQGLTCAKLIQDPAFKLVQASGTELKLATKLSQIFILCVVSDHYPALSVQSREFLEFEVSDSILPPLVVDVFLIDVLCEMLTSPLYFLSYVERRSKHLEKVSSLSELTVLSYHLKKNLWFDEEYDLVHLDDDISQDLDVAMLVRREGVPGNKTPDGILTHIEGSSVGDLISSIENIENPITVNFGFTLLEMNGESIGELSKGLQEIVKLSLADKKCHDFTIGMGDTGITVHCNGDAEKAARAGLADHCKRRKYLQKASRWFGVCIEPDPKMTIRFGIYLDFPWTESAAMNRLLASSRRGRPVLHKKTQRKIGRNDPCPCGSKRKYKNCCINRPNF